MKTLILTENNFGFWDIYRRFGYEKEKNKNSDECKRLCKMLFQ